MSSVSSLISSVMFTNSPRGGEGLPASDEAIVGRFEGLREFCNDAAME